MHFKNRIAKRTNTPDNRRIPISSLVNPVEEGSTSTSDSVTSLYASPTLSERETLSIRIQIGSFPTTAQTPAVSQNSSSMQNVHITNALRSLQLGTPPPSRSPTPRPATVVRGSKAPSRLPHSNQPYFLQELDWIKYHKEDCNAGGKQYQWGDLVKKYRQDFPSSIARDTPSALNSRYYRTNMYPILDEKNIPVLLSNGQVKLTKLNPKAKVPTRQHQQLRRLGYFSFVTSHPERAIRYWWVKEADKERARELIRKRKAAGLPPSVPYYDYHPRQIR